MKRPELLETWPDSWKRSYSYDLQEVYGEVSTFGYAYSYANRRKQTLRLVTEALEPGTRILDIAGAQGNFSIALAEMGYEVTWNDLREELAGYVRQKHDNGNLHFAPGNAFELDFPTLFDAVVITEVIEHVAHPDDFLRKTAQLVKPGGYIIMTTPNGAYIENKLPRFSDCPDPSIYENVQFGPDADDHVFLLYADEVRRFAIDAGLEVEEIAFFSNSLTCGLMKMEHLLRILPRSVVDAIEGATGLLPNVLSQRLLFQIGARFRLPSDAVVSSSSNV